MNANTVDGGSAAAKDVLLAELQIFESAIWRSEETGEKRFHFFITLFTAVRLVQVQLDKRDIVERERARLERKQRQALGRPHRED